MQFIPYKYIFTLAIGLAGAHSTHNSLNYLKISFKLGIKKNKFGIKWGWREDKKGKL
jgi:hypothetical protein